MVGMLIAVILCQMVLIAVTLLCPTSLLCLGALREHWKQAMQRQLSHISKARAEEQKALEETRRKDEEEEYGEEEEEEEVLTDEEFTGM